MIVTASIVLPVAPCWRSPMSSSQAEAEGLTLRKADNKTGYFGVVHRPGDAKPYAAKVKRGGKTVGLGSFATAEEAALCIARSPEGRAAAAKRAAPQLSEKEGKGTVPPMPPGAFVKEEQVAPPMAPDAIVKLEHEVVVKEEERSGCTSDDRPKRQRSK